MDLAANDDLDFTRVDGATVQPLLTWKKDTSTLESLGIDKAPHSFKDRTKTDVKLGGILYSSIQFL